MSALQRRDRSLQVCEHDTLFVFSAARKGVRGPLLERRYLLPQLPHLAEQLRAVDVARGARLGAAGGVLRGKVAEEGAQAEGGEGEEGVMPAHAPLGRRLHRHLGPKMRQGGRPLFTRPALKLSKPVVHG